MALEPNSLRVVLLEGYLLKKDRQRSFMGSVTKRRYKKRWFQLTRDALSYARHPLEIKTGVEVSTFPLAELSEVKQRNAKKNKFEVRFSSCVLLLRAASEAEMDKWLQILAVDPLGQQVAKLLTSNIEALRQVDVEDEEETDIKEVLSATKRCSLNNEPHARGGPVIVAVNPDEEAFTEERNPSPHSLLSRPEMGHVLIPDSLATPTYHSVPGRAVQVRGLSGGGALVKESAPERLQGGWSTEVLPRSGQPGPLNAPHLEEEDEVLKLHDHPQQPVLLEGQSTEIPSSLGPLVYPSSSSRGTHGHIPEAVGGFHTLMTRKKAGVSPTPPCQPPTGNTGEGSSRGQQTDTGQVLLPSTMQSIHRQESHQRLVLQEEKQRGLSPQDSASHVMAVMRGGSGIDPVLAGADQSWLHDDWDHSSDEEEHREGTRASHSGGGYPPQAGGNVLNDDQHDWLHEDFDAD